MTRALASEYAKSGVTFNCVCPFYVDTPMLAAAVDSLVTGAGLSRSRASAALMSPQGRYILVDEVAAACMWLASPDGRSVNGQAINIDGGRVQS
jgi:NAD(P)-dependent dehydrogenase (short-subunit alcohol dehydrogenase family)